MKLVAFALLLMAVVVGCTSIVPVPPGTLTPEEVAIRQMNLEGLKLGDRTSALSRFAQVQKVPYGRSDYEVYDIYNPSRQLSLVKAYFANDRLKRLEFLYFDGTTTNTLSRVGGWKGLKNYLISKFGPPSREGDKVAIVTDEPGVKAKDAKCNSEWIFSRQHRQLNYVALSDGRGGVAVVTLQDVTPAPLEAPAPPPKTGRVTVVRSQPVAASNAPAAPAPQRQKTLGQMPPPPPDPGF